MAIPLVYQSGEEILKGDRVLIHGEPGEVEDVFDDDVDLQVWPYSRGVMIAEPKVFGRLFLTDTDISNEEDLEFLARSK